MNGTLASGFHATLLRYRIPLLLLIGALIYVAFLGLRDLWYPDELDIAEVTRAMFRSGDWISPRRMGEIWVDYPPMVYWIGTVSSHLLGGMSAFSLRLPNALAALITVFLVYATGKRWFDVESGFWSAITLATFVLFVYEGNSYRPDVTFTLAITAGIFAYADGAGDRPRLWSRALAFACFGLAMLAKGPLGLLLPGLILVLWLGARRQWLRIAELAPLSLVSAAVYLPWYFANAQAMGWDNMLYEFYAQNFERFLTAENRGHMQPWYYFLRNFWLNFFPWSFLFPFAAWWHVRSGRLRDARVQLALWWFGASFVFLSIAATKRELYLLPAYPAVALLLGTWFADLCRTSDHAGQLNTSRPARIYTLIVTSVFLLVGAGLLIWSWWLPEIAAGMDLNEQEQMVATGARIPFAVMGIAMLGGGAWMGLAWRNGRVGDCLVSIGGSHVILYVAILGLIMPAWNPVKTYEPQSRWISEQIGDATHFGMVDPWGVPRRGGFAYYTGTMVDLLDDAQDVEAFFARHPGSVVLIRDVTVEKIFAADEAAWRRRVLREIRVGSHLYTVVGGPKQDG